MIVYLHGLNSTGNSAKARWLREHLPGVRVLSPTYPAHRAAEAPARLRAFLAQAQREHTQERRLLLVGSSLGGFWAQHLAPEFGAGLVLINPSTRPQVTLTRYLGPQTIDGSDERYALTETDVQAFGKFALGSCRPEVPTLVLLDEADEVIDYRFARDLYRGCGRTLVYPGGSHRFEHLADARAEILALHDSL